MKSHRRLSRALSALAAAVAILVPLAVAGPAQAATSPIGENRDLRIAGSDACIDVPDWSREVGRGINMWTCKKEGNQAFTVRDLGNGNVELSNRHSDLCLDVPGASTAPGEAIVQWTCSGSSNQQWRLEDLGDGVYRIVADHSDLCLEGDGAGSTIRQDTCDGSTGQRWEFSEMGEALFTYTLYRSANPTADELDAYARITEAMDKATARYNRLTEIERHVSVFYDPNVGTAEAYGSDIKFGAGRQYMQEGTALHEMSHTHGVGTSQAWFDGCADDARWDGPSTTAQMEAWDGPGAYVGCAGQHMGPYGLNYADEYTETNMDRHAIIVEMMERDGL